MNMLRHGLPYLPPLFRPCYSTFSVSDCRFGYKEEWSDLCGRPFCTSSPHISSSRSSSTLSYKHSSPLSRVLSRGVLPAALYNYFVMESHKCVFQTTLV